MTADGRRPAERWRKAPGGASGRTFTCPALIGDPWPLAVAVVEGGADALALARLRLPGVLVRSAAGTSGLRSIGGAVVADLPATVAVALLSDGGDEGREAVLKLHADLRAADPARACYSAMLAGGDPDEVLHGADAADLTARHAERAAIYEYDDGLPRGAATARALARLIEQLTPEETR